MQLRTFQSRQTRSMALIPALVAIGALAGRVEAQAQRESTLAANSYRGHEPTFSKDVAPILYANCTTCHRPGGMGPMSLVTYAGAKRSAARIRKAVENGIMPPWQADSPHGVFSNDRRLSDGDKATITAWVDAGAPEGDPSDLPPAPVYPDSWTAGTPDVVLSMTESFNVPATGTIEYQYFEVPTNFTEDKWVSTFEILPGSRKSVHHVIVFARSPKAATPPASQGATADESRPAKRPPLFQPDSGDYPDPPPPPPPGSEPKNQEPERDLGALVGATAPGTNVVTFPAGAALRIPAGTVLTFQMHYTAHGHNDQDKTSVGLTLSKLPVSDQVRADNFLNAAFAIPPGAKDYLVSSGITVRDTVRIWGMIPHTHLRGVRWEYELIHPDGRVERVLSVPRYDFNWQTYYMFATPLVIPAGARLHAMAWYDNSATNKANPDATKEVHWGDQTWEEMQYTAFFYSMGAKPKEQKTAESSKP